MTMPRASFAPALACAFAAGVATIATSAALASPHLKHDVVTVGSPAQHPPGPGLGLKTPTRPARAATVPAAEAARVPVPVAASAAAPAGTESPQACAYVTPASGVVQSFASTTDLSFAMNINYWTAIGV